MLVYPVFVGVVQIALDLFNPSGVALFFLLFISGYTGGYSYSSPSGLGAICHELVCFYQ